MKVLKNELAIAKKGQTVLLWKKYIGDSACQKKGDSNFNVAGLIKEYDMF